MRQIGQLDNELDARTFGDFLFNQGVECDLENSQNGSWLIWVHDEDRMAEVAGWLAEFKLNPGGARFVAGAEGAEAKRSALEKEQRAFERKQRKVSARNFVSGWGVGHVTLGLVLASVAVSLLISFGQNETVFRWLMISQFPPIPDMKLFLPEVREGQVWRLITPVFMHLGVIHLLFNMMWLWDLGGMIERIRSPIYLAVFVLITGMVSNMAQYFISGPAFGGMSGVVYGLLGYVWLQSRLNPWSGFEMHSFTVNMMLVWLALGMTGLIGPIANTTHLAGLLIGCFWGYLDARRTAV